MKYDTFGTFDKLNINIGDQTLLGVNIHKDGDRFHKFSS